MKENLQFSFSSSVCFCRRVSEVYEGKWRRANDVAFVGSEHVYKMVDDIYFVLCTSFAIRIYVNTHACIISTSSGKIWP